MLSSSSSNLPWLEKYRPKRFEDIVGNDEVVSSLKIFSVQGNVPNILLAGSPGCGKTTTIMCLIRNLYNDDEKSFKNNTLELNASDERGIDTIRERIKLFCQQKHSTNDSTTSPQHRHKFVILDEADSLTSAAQQALRRIIEIYSTTTRFALACNDSSKIIEPIQSRCAVLRFKPLDDEAILKRLLAIIEHEGGVRSTDDGLEAILRTAQGDMRQAINSLEACHSTFGLVTAEAIYKLSDEPNPKIIMQMLNFCIEGKYFESYDILCMLLNKGFMPEDLMQTINKQVQSLDQPEFIVLECIKLSALTHLRIAKGSNSRLQLAGLLASIFKLCNVKSFKSRPDHKSAEFV